MTDRLAQFEAALDRMGNTHSVHDILTRIESGLMQSFAVDDDTWAITEIVDLPQRRVLDIFLVIGKRDDLDDLYGKVLAFAKATGCTLVRAFGRDGWLPDAKAHGWRADTRLYLKELG